MKVRWAAHDWKITHCRNDCGFNYTDYGIERRDVRDTHKDKVATISPCSFFVEKEWRHDDIWTVVASSPQPPLNRRFRHVKLACGVSKRVSFRHSCHKFSVIRCRLLDHVESTVMSRCYVACLAALIVHGQSDCNRLVLIGVRVANVLFLFMMKMSLSTTWTYFVSFWCRIEYVVDEVQLNCPWYIKKCMHKKNPLFRK